jgi:predicted transcriptional regulator of viral defense system
MAKSLVQERLLIASRDIVGYLDAHPKKTFSSSDLKQILEEQRDFWRLEGVSVNKFISYLKDSAKLKETVFEFPDRRIYRYSWDIVPLYQLVFSLQPDGYFSHYTALYLNNLTQQIPKTIYLNQEQTPKPKSDSDLEQKRIDYAFKTAPRVSNRKAFYNDYTILLLNGKNTGNAGVVEIVGPDHSQIRTTSIERTLIDITVRPEYAGGPFEILQAYRNAADQVSINKLSALLKKLDYVYPYHQAIGFYLEKSGVYKESQINLMRKADIVYNFYLMHKMTNPVYSSKWKLYYPEGLA